MSKKNFKTAFDSLLEGTPIKNNNIEDKELRATFILKANLYEKMKAISFWEKKMLKIIMDEALSKFVEDYEKKKGPLQLPR